MKKFLIVTQILFVFQISNQTVRSQVRPENIDPDLPSFSNGVDKEQYLKAREDNINMIRGLPWTLTYNPRVKAINEMKQQEYVNLTNPNNLLQAPNWQELGPAPIPNGQTTTFSVAVSGRITAIVVHPTNANLVYAGTANGGIYRTTDGGNSWTQIFDNANSLAIGALTLAPSNPSTLYVGTGEANLSGDSYAGVGLYRIDNADVSPSLVGPINPLVTTSIAGTTAFTGRTISKILVDPTNAAIIYVSTASGIIGNIGFSPYSTIPPLAIRGVYRSTNATAAAGAVTFNKLTVTTGGSVDAPGTGNRSITDMVMEPGNPDIITCWALGSTAIGDGGIYRTTNASAASPTFTQTYTCTTPSSRGSLTINKVAGVVTEYCGSGDLTNGKILKSIDGGLTWVQVPGSYTFCGGQCFYDIAIAVDPTDANKLYVGGSSGSNIFKYSLDGGTTFITSTTNLHADVHAITVAPSLLSTLYFGCDGGVFKSVNSGLTWTSQNTTGLRATQFQSLAVHPTNINFTIGGTQDNGTIMLKTDGTFTRIDGGDGGFTAIDQNAPDVTNVTEYHTYFNQTSNLIGFARSTVVGDGFPNFYGCGGTANGISCTDNTLFYAPMVLGPGNPNTVYFGTDRLYRSIDQGVTMTVVSQAPIVATQKITSIATEKSGDTVRIVGLTNGTVWTTSTGSATLVNISPFATSNSVGRIIIDPNNKNIAFVSYIGAYGIPADQRVWKTSNLTKPTPIWTASGNGIPDVPVNALAIDPGNSNLVYAGTDIGVYISTNGGSTWTSYNTGLPIVPVFDMVVHPVSHLLKIATHGRGFWTTNASPVPVTYTSFTASPRSNGKVYLEWYTSSEFNNKGFELQVALKTNTTPAWKKVAFVNGSGSTTSPKRYYYEDQPIGGKKLFYRIKQNDIDGRFKYFDIREVELKDFDYGIYQNYPNPTNGNTTIKFQLPQDGNVSLVLFNNLGATVRILANETKQAGIYVVDLNTSGLPAGNYYYTYSVNGFTMTKNMTLVK